MLTWLTCVCVRNETAVCFAVVLNTSAENLCCASQSVNGLAELIRPTFLKLTRMQFYSAI
ncbi:hypothetical protein T4A_9404 [Trichinella pseudospiralis]|uniref:Uncharacterized protein n=1 Tax=Trichinella pseudospiralis TaxID=6337 RepID=A0A0V1ENP6_TRIPS|nr:hypothetical protein T4A_9404 [Trichinella pseudospiralis]